MTIFIAPPKKYERRRAVRRLSVSALADVSVRLLGCRIEGARRVGVNSSDHILNFFSSKFTRAFTAQHTFAFCLHLVLL
jgi:hypothetical protein